MPSPRRARSRARSRSIARHSSSSSLATLATMRARDGVEEDLSAYAREDLVYKAKLAEQAERCARNRIARRRVHERGRSSVGNAVGGLVDDGARRAEATETRPNARACARDDRARDRSRHASRIESIRIDSIRSSDRTNERTNGRRIERTIDRCATRDARRRARSSRSRRVRGWWTGKGVETRDEGRIDASPRPRADRGRWARERERVGGNASESKRCEARGD